MHESDSITSITTSLGFVVPEVILVVSMCIALLMGLFLKKNKSIALALFTVCVFVVTSLCIRCNNWFSAF